MGSIVQSMTFGLAKNSSYVQKNFDAITIPAGSSLTRFKYETSQASYSYERLRNKNNNGDLAWNTWYTDFTLLLMEGNIPRFYIRNEYSAWVEQTVTLTIEYTDPNHTVTVSAGTGGTASASKTSAVSGETITITCSPSTGYSANTPTASGITFTSAGTNKWTFTMPNSNVTVSCTFSKISYDVTVSAGTGGSASRDKATATMGETVTITCTPSAGYSANTPTASGITFTSAGTNKWTFTMPASAVTVSCTFSKISYNVTVTAGTGGSASSNKTTAQIGDTVTITCSPSTGYKANTPTASGIAFTSAGTNKWTFTMPAAAVTVSCTFSKIAYTVSKSDGTGGSSSLSKTSANYGDTITVTCSPSTGYKANAPTASGITFTSAGTNKWTFTMPAAAVTVSCTFSKISYTISKAASPAAGGTVTVGATSATMGTEVTVSQTPAAGYYFNGWTINPSSVTISSGKFTMPAGNVSITANYLKRSTATLSSASMTGGGAVTLTISPDKASYSHKYNLSFGTGMATGMVNVAAGTNTVTISVPLTWSAQIPSATSKTGGTLTLETYNGSTKIGTYTISSLTYNVPASVVPSIGTITTSIVRTIGGTTYANIGNYYVQNKSGVRVQCSASGAQSSSISSLEVTMSGYSAAAYKKTVSAASVDFTSGLLKNSGSCTITVKATDSRGRTATKTASITVQAYNRPSGSLRVWRVDNAGNTDPLGTYAKYEKSSSYTAVGSNSLTVTLTGGGGSATNPANSGNILPNSRKTFSQTSEYTISMTLTDAFETVTIQTILPTAQFMIFVNANGDRIGFMKATNESLSKNGKQGTIEFSGNHQLYIGNDKAEDYFKQKDAIKNITRNGTTFTATRVDGTTFTFTQQDSDHYAWSDITNKPESATRWPAWNEVTGKPSAGNATQGVYFNSGTPTGVTWHPTYCTISSGNVSNYPWHRFATCTTGTGQYVDKSVIVVLHSRFNGGAYGIIKLNVRTNSSGTAMNSSAVWLFRYGFAANDVKITTGGTTGTNTTFNAYVRCGTYARRIAYIMEGSNLGWSLVNSNEPVNTTSSDKKGGTEINASVSGADATDGATVSYANTAGNGISNITRNGTTFTVTRQNGTTFTFTQQDNNTNTWRPVQNNLTSTSTTDCLSAAQGKALNDSKEASRNFKKLKGSVTIAANNKNAEISLAVGEAASNFMWVATLNDDYSGVYVAGIKANGNNINVYIEAAQRRESYGMTAAITVSFAVLGIRTAG